MYFPKDGLRNTRLDKSLKSFVSEDPSKSNVVNSHKHCWNLHDSTLIIVNNYGEGNLIGKSLS